MEKKNYFLYMVNFFMNIKEYIIPFHSLVTIQYPMC